MTSDVLPLLRQQSFYSINLEFLKKMTEEEKAELNKLERQLDRLQRNFTKMVKDAEETDMMLDWMNQIRKRIKVLRAQ